MGELTTSSAAGVIILTVTVVVQHCFQSQRVCILYPYSVPLTHVADRVAPWTNFDCPAQKFPPRAVNKAVWILQVSTVGMHGHGFQCSAPSFKVCSTPDVEISYRFRCHGVHVRNLVQKSLASVPETRLWISGCCFPPLWQTDTCRVRCPTRFLKEPSRNLSAGAPRHSPGTSGIHHDENCSILQVKRRLRNSSQRQ